MLAKDLILTTITLPRHLFLPRHLPTHTQRFWNTISRYRPPVNDSIPLRERCKIFAHHAHSLTHAARNHHNQLINARRKAPNRRNEENDVDLPECSAYAPPGARNKNEEKGRQKQTLWKWLRTRGKDSTSAKQAPAKKCDPPPKVVEVYSRKQQAYGALKRKRKGKSMAVTSAPATAAHLSSSAQAGTSSQGGSAQAGASLKLVSAQAGPSLQDMSGHGAQYVQVTGGPSPYISPSQFATTYPTTPITTQIHARVSRAPATVSSTRYVSPVDTLMNEHVD
ncbi:hypothetical protein DFH29DRAFT_1004987 [Suillus ampliporus]|nr:hypothetical protein DFH29DRAFT_1004987 [Suillus ampliporus]